MDKPLRKSESNQMIINSVACMQKNSKKFENCVGFSTSPSERQYFSRKLKQTNTVHYVFYKGQLILTDQELPDYSILQKLHLEFLRIILLKLF